MKPATKKFGGRSAVAAAKTALRAELGWLRGYPSGAVRHGELPWTVVPAPAPRAVSTELAVDRLRLREANLAFATLPRRYPRALARTLALDDGDVDAWVERGRRLLGWLSAAVHTGAPLPRLASADEGPLLPLVEALSWVHALDPDALARALRVARARAAPLAVLLAQGPARSMALELALRLVDLAADEPRGSAPALIDLLGHPALWSTPLELDPSKVEQLIATLGRAAKPAKAKAKAEPWKPFEPPTARVGEAVFTLAFDALARDPRARERSLTTIADVVPLALVERWSGWWRSVEGHAAAARRLLASERASRHEKHRLRAIADALRGLLRERPPQVRSADVRRAATQAMELSSLAAERLHAVLARIEPLAATTWHDTARIDLARSILDEPRHAERVLGIAVQLPPVAALNGSTVRALVDLGDELARLAPVLTDALGRLTRAGDQVAADPGRFDLLVEHARRFKDGAAAAAFAAASACGVHVPWPFDRAVVSLCGREPAKLRALAAVFANAKWSRELGDALADLAAFDAARPLLVDALGAGDLARVKRLCVRASLVRGLTRLADVSPPPAPSSASGSPTLDPLAEELAALDRLSPTAPEPRASWMRARAASLRERLAGRGFPVPPRRARAASRAAARRALRAGLDAWEAALDLRAREVLSAWLGATPPPEWLSCPRVLAVLSGLCTLPARWRPLARRVLRARLLSRAPWDLRDARANATFVARLRARGLDVAPWLDGLPVRTWTAPNGRASTLRLEDDPLEVLQMGAVFGTCLSPGESNFFAALVDAADVNKRVLYGRADTGRIIGRCLLALTADGELITYHPYCHEPRHGFPEQVRRFVEDLARAMGTTVTSTGEVPTLLAGDWYADAPEDLLGVSAVLDVALRHELSVAAPATVPALLEGALGRALDAPTVARALDLPEVDARPELALGLAPHVLALRTPARTRVRAVERLVAAGAHDAADAVARAVRADDLEPHDIATLARALVALGRAREVGELLRRTVRERLEAEHHEALGLACEALYRRAAAREHYRAATETLGCYAARERCRARLSAVAAAQPSALETDVVCAGA